MLSDIKIPNDVARNHPSIRQAGVERTGKLLIQKTIDFAGLESLAETRVLDIGCGTRFTSSIINKKIPIGSYTGVDVNKRVIDYLKAHVEPNDERFRYHHWDVENALYNEQGNPFDGQSPLPIDASEQFGMIWMYSVITHQYPEGAAALFEILRKHVNTDGQMFFTAFTHPGVEKFVDWREGKPLMEAYFEPAYLEELLANTGWKVSKILPADTEHVPKLHQDGYLCTPA